MSTIIKTFKYRIYPDKNQREILAKHFGAQRFVYNYFLAQKKDAYLNNKTSSSYNKDARSLTLLKEQDGYSWLYDVNAQSLQHALRNLDVAYQNFFNKKSKFPRFHSRKSTQSFKIPQFFTVTDNLLKIPKLKKPIKINLHRELPSKQLSCSITKTATNKYYANFPCEIEVVKLPENNYSIGIDLGLKDLIITSEGVLYDNKKPYRTEESNIKYYQRVSYLTIFYYNFLTFIVFGTLNSEPSRLKNPFAFQKNFLGLSR